MTDALLASFGLLSRAGGPSTTTVVAHGVPGSDSPVNALVTLAVVAGTMLVGIGLLKMSERRSGQRTDVAPLDSDDHAHRRVSGHSHEGDQGHHHAHAHVHVDKAGRWGWLRSLYLPHSHDAADSLDSALESSAAGIRAVKISLAALLATAVLQTGIVVLTGSVALLADTIHNFSDALTSIPLWIAFVLGRRAATTSYTFGYRRAEDLSGLFIVMVIALSAVLAGWESVDRLMNPVEVDNLGIVALAGLVGFAGNEFVAIYRIRVGREIGSAALVADGKHARIDGLTSLAVVVGAGGVALGFPAADPIVGLLITVAILLMLRDAGRQVFRRLMDAVEPSLVREIEARAMEVEGILSVRRVRVRWIGHRLDVSLHAEVPGSLSLVEAYGVAESVRAHLFDRVGKLEEVTVFVEPEGTVQQHTAPARLDAGR